MNNNKNKNNDKNSDNNNDDNNNNEIIITKYLFTVGNIEMVAKQLIKANKIAKLKY